VLKFKSLLFIYILHYKLISFTYGQLKTLIFFRSLESAELHTLRSSSNSLLDILKVLSEVSQKFDLKFPSAEYDHF